MKKLFFLILVLFVSISAQAATSYYDTIAVDADSYETYAPATRSTLTHSHTSVGTPSIAICQAYGCINAVSSATYGGVSMTRSTAWHGVATGEELFYLVNPPTGTQSVVVTLAGSATTSGFVVCSTFTGTGSNVPEGNCPGVSGISATSADTGLQNFGRGAPDWQWAGFRLFNSPAETVIQTTDTQVANMQFSCGGTFETYVVSREIAGGDGSIHYNWTNPLDFDGVSIAIMAARQSIISPTVSGTIASDSNFVTTKGCQVLR